MEEGASHKSALEYLLSSSPRVCCHRGGASSFGPENTMHNYKLAVYQCKVDVLEIDIRSSKDGHLVIMHDGSVDRTTNGTGNLEDMTLKEIKALDAAYRYPGLRGTGITVPTVDEVLDEFVKVPNLVFIFDIKTTKVVSQVMQIVKERKLEKRVIFVAVFPSVNEEVMKQKPKDIPLATDIKTVAKMMVLHWLGLLWLYPVKHEIFGFILIDRTVGAFTENLIKAVKKRGQAIAIFGPILDSKEAQKKYMSMGCDLILSDRPDVLRECADEIASLSNEVSKHTT